jgi:hypothetical protein
MSLGPGDLLPLNSLTGRGVVQGSDLFPTLPTGALVLESQTATAIQGFVLNSVTQWGADPTGASDSTSAIQAGINSGLPIYFPPGVYVVSSTLTITGVANHGQIIRGSGATASDGTGTNKTIIRPTSVVTTVFTIDGTPFGGYIQGLCISDLTIDMVNVTDASTSIAFNQIQAFDCTYERVRLINDGVNKTGFRFNAGAYDTNLTNCQFGQLVGAGQSAGNRATTIGFFNCDIRGVSLTWTLNFSFFGGSIQGPYKATSVQYLAPGVSPYGYTLNTVGLYICPYVNIDSALHTSFYGTDFENGGGYPTTFNDGTHGTFNLISGVKVTANATNTIFINPGFEGCYLYDLGVRTRA